jgi:hypothetical protein
MSMAYDPARSEVVVFGGSGELGNTLGDTWAWDGTTWRVATVAHLDPSPHSGGPGTLVEVKGKGFAAYEQVTITFVDSTLGNTVLGTFATDASGALREQVAIPGNATVGPQRIKAVGARSHQKAKARFTVT